MEARGFERVHKEPFPLTIREHARKYQYIVADASAWKKSRLRSSDKLCCTTEVIKQLKLCNLKIFIRLLELKFKDSFIISLPAQPKKNIVYAKFKYLNKK